MDTPERNQIGTPLSKFEDSPVFNYINSLSPIKPVKSANVAQTFNSLSFAAIPSVFTSPHVKEFRFLQRHQSSNQDKYGKSSDHGNKVSSVEGVTDSSQLYGNSSVPPGSSHRDESFESDDEHPKLEVHLTQSLKFDCHSPEDNPKPCSSGGRDAVPELACLSASAVPSVQEASKKGSLQGGVHLQDICQTEQKREESVCDWESLISDASHLLIFNSPDGTETFHGPIQKSNPGTSVCSPLVSEFPRDDFTDLHKQCSVPVSSGIQQEDEDPSGELKEIEQPPDSQADISPSKSMTYHRIKIMDDEARKALPFSSKPAFNLHRGMQRRLVFEMTAARRKNLNNALDTGSSNQLQSDGNVSSNDKQQGPFKLVSDTSRHTLPGIGLHLNSLAVTLKDHKFVKHEIMAAESQLTSGTNSNASVHSPSTNQEPTINSLDLICSERDKDPNESGFHVEEDTLQASLYAAIEEFNQSSPKKKRRKLEQAGEPDACKRCNCKKSKCLKLYCECFAAGVYCVEPCSCQECFNKPIHEDTVLATRKQIESRNPLAFAPKVIRSLDSVAEVGDEPNKTPASARHKRGCNCKKSSCLKKYCECYQGGVGCSISCRCEGCKNAFGRKDGSAPLGTDAEPEDEETETGEKGAVDEHLRSTVIHNSEEENLDSAPPITPLQIARPSTQLPFPSKRKPLPPRSSFLGTASSSLLHINERLGKPNFLPPQPKFEHFRTVVEDEMPDILHCSPSTGIKTASPNSKRVSPPHCDFGSSPSRPSSRKLILKSIPSFPSLTQN